MAGPAPLALALHQSMGVDGTDVVPRSLFIGDNEGLDMLQSFLEGYSPGCAAGQLDKHALAGIQQAALCCQSAPGYSMGP